MSVQLISSKSQARSGGAVSSHVMAQAAKPSLPPCLSPSKTRSIRVQLISGLFATSILLLFTVAVAVAFPSLGLPRPSPSAGPLLSAATLHITRPRALGKPVMSNFKPQMGKMFRTVSRQSVTLSRTASTAARPNGSSPNGNEAATDGANEHSSLLHPHMPNLPHVPKYYQDDRPYISYPAAFLHTSWEVLKSNYANVFLVFVPLGIIAGACAWDPVAIFCLNFIAIIPLAGLLAFATEELAAKLGQTIGGLLNATFGNAVELIVSIVALREGQIRIVQSSMLGSILSNILLVLGCCFISSGVRRQESHFDVTVAQTMSSLMAVACASLIIPATLYAALQNSGQNSDKDTEENILILSHGAAIILLILYLLYLFFQLKTHANLFDVESHDSNEGEGQDGEEQADNEEEPQILAPIPAGIALVLVTLCVAVCAEYLVDSIDSIVQRVHISKTFIGLILLPIVGNAAEHVTAVVVSWKGKMDLALGVAIGSSTQIALFVTPFLVILGWIIGQPMTLHFQGFETVVFFLSVLVVNYLIQDGKSNYLEGCMCLGTYTIIALAFYVYPDDAGDIGSSISHFFDRSV